MQSFKVPKDDKKYSWTWHVIDKMKYYKISPSRVKRVIRHPDRTEEGIVSDTVASMKIAKTKKRQEIWAMYIPAQKNGEKKIKIITAWRYPGESPKRDPVPKNILEEVKELL